MVKSCYLRFGSKNQNLVYLEWDIFSLQARHCQELLQTDAGKQAAVILPRFA